MLRGFAFFSLAALLALCSSTLPGCAGGTRVGNGYGSGAESVTTTTPEQDADRLFDVLDVNGDGKVSKEEARSGFRYMIASYDRGGKIEVLAAKAGETPSSASRKSKRKPTNQDATRAFDSLFVNNVKNKDALSREEFKKIVIRSGSASSDDPFAAFM